MLCYYLSNKYGVKTNSVDLGWFGVHQYTSGNAELGKYFFYLGVGGVFLCILFAILFHRGIAKTTINVYENGVEGIGVNQYFLFGDVRTFGFRLTYNQITSIDVTNNVIIIHASNSQYKCYVANSSRIQNIIFNQKNGTTTPSSGGTSEFRAEAEKEKAAREQSAKEKAEKQKAETDQIIANYKTALHDNPDDAKAYEQRGLEFCDKGYFDLGIADYTQVIRINPDNAAVYRLRGIAYSQIKDYNKAIADYDNAIRLKPDDSEAFSHRGMAYSQKQEYDKAIADFNEALRLDPHNANAYFGRGFAYKQTGNYDQAIADCEFVLRVEPNNTASRQVLDESRNLKEKAAKTSAEKARRYSQLLQSKDKASTEEQYRSLVGEFRAMNGYENSTELANECENAATKIKYDRLVQEKNRASKEGDWRNLAEQFRAMNGYENTAELAKECENQYQALKKCREKEAARKAKQEKARKLITTVFVIVAVIGVIVGYVVYNSQENSLTIPDSVTIIKIDEYKGKRLIHVDIPDSVTFIGDEAFKQNKLTSITIPDSVTTIGSFAFAKNQLTSITIGSNVRLGSDAFGFGFDNFYRNNGEGSGTYKRPDVKSTKWDVWYDNFRYQNNDGKITILDYNGTGGTVEIPAEISGKPVTVIGGRSFSMRQLTSVTIPNNVTSIERQAFCENQLTSITIPNSVKFIERDAFVDNPLTSVSIGANVTLSPYGDLSEFNIAYSKNGSRAGTYTRPNINSTTWTRR